MRAQPSALVKGLMGRIAMDPSVSAKQHRAMEAAAHGHSTLGIPAKVGKEFVRADDASPVRGAGIMFVTPDNRALFIRRTKENEDGVGVWDFPGGKTDGEETPEETAKRETLEEIGALPYGERSLAVSHKRKDGFVFDTFRQPILRTFKPKLSPEHDLHVWAPLDHPPEPLHPAIKDEWKQLAQDAWQESKHPRGQPGNAGQFGPGRGSSKSAMPSEAAEKFASRWLEGEQATNIAAAMMRIVQEKHSEHPEFDRSLGSAKGSGGSTPESQKELEARIKRGHKSLGGKEAAEAAADEIYAKTQEQLGGKTLVLYRGIRKEEGNGGNKILESWTSDPAVAKEFAQKATAIGGGSDAIILRAEVPAERVFATTESLQHFVGNGKASDYGIDEHEFVVIAGKGFKSDVHEEIRSKVIGGRIRRAQDAEGWSEEKHPRGQPGNAGQFGAGGGSSGEEGKSEKAQPRSASLEAAHADREQWPDHIKALKVPLAWTNVMVNKDPRGDLLVAGRDAKGRGQAIYSSKFVAAQAAAKFARIKELDAKFGEIQKQNQTNQKSSDQQVREHADCMALIMGMGVRPGSEADTGAEVQAYGATTLRGGHVVEENGQTSLRFTGKKGVALDLPVTNPKIAAMLKNRSAKAGPDGKLFPGISDGSLLKYTHSFDGGGFKTKDFRTLLATRTAMDAIGKAQAPTNEKEYQKAVKQVAVEVSKKLSNTPVVALQSYINPVVFAGWQGATQMAHDAAPAMQGPHELPDAHFGSVSAPLPDWRKLGDTTGPDDDEELPETPHDVVAMLGFDPLDSEDKQAQDSMAFDRASVRSVDQDGRMHVELTNISKANVCPYKGSEIPDSEALGLDPNKVYKLLRDPEELDRAASSFNNLPLLDEHVPVSAQDPQKELIVGSTGTDAVFEAPYLMNSMVIWDAEAIAKIESKEQQEISCAYHYVADMTPGEYDGEHYDGIMRQIKGNHVALVATGRAGPDVVVGDARMNGDGLIMKTVGDAGFEEGKHPRAENGQFGSGGSSEKTRSAGKASKDTIDHAKLQKLFRDGDFEAVSDLKTYGSWGTQEVRSTKNGKRMTLHVENIPTKDSKPASGRAVAKDGQNRSFANQERNMLKKSLSKKAVMAKGALLALLAPKLAADAMPNLDTVLSGVGHKNWFSKKPGIVAALRPYLAQDDDTIQEVIQSLDRIDGENPGENENENTENDNIGVDSPADAVMEKLRGKISDEDLAEVQAMIEALCSNGATDEDEKAKLEAERLEKEKAAGITGDNPPPFNGKPEIPAKKDEMVSKAAMDSAIKVAGEQATKNALVLARSISAAEEAIKPYVGKLAIAFDSAEGVYKAALQAMGVKVDGVHPSAFKSILEAQPRPGQQPRLVAQDNASGEDFSKRFPNSDRLLAIG